MICWLMTCIFRAWQSLQEATRCRGLVLVYNSKVVIQAGTMAEEEDEEGKVVEVNAPELLKGSVCATAFRNKSQSK